MGFIGAVAVGLSACGGTDAASSSASAAPAAPASQGPKEASLLVPGEDRFAPFVIDVAPSGAIQITNKDTDAHTVTSLPGDKSQFDVTIKGGETQVLTLTQSGVYRFYCKLHAKYLPDKDAVAALPSAGFPDQPMEGVIVVG
jgi:plastocyanin